MDPYTLCDSCRELTTAHCALVQSTDESRQNQRCFIPLQSPRNHKQIPTGATLRGLHSTSWILQKLELKATSDSEIHLWRYERFGDLLSNARRRVCRFCFLICEDFMYAEYEERPTADQSIFAYFSEQVSGENFELNISYFSRHGVAEGPWFNIKRYIEPNEIGINVASGVRLETLTRLRAWLQSSKRVETTAFSGGDTKKALPTRLIRIETSPGGINARLVETGSLNNRVDYAVLSHCWGPRGLSVTLLDENYASWLQHIPVDALAKTFREAIQVAPLLGLEYLWIDALCIKQDPGGADWAIEAPRMCDVYSRSAVNFSANASASGDGGLIVQNIWLQPCVVPFKLRGAIAVSGKWSIANRQSYSRYVRLAPLHNRAWVKQERLLSNRFIHFSEDQIWWEDEHELDNETRDEPEKFGKHVSLDRRHWTYIIEDYSQTALTFPKDRLIAISGVAEAYGRRNSLSPGDYLAGLWRKQLQQQLLWLAPPELAINPSEVVPSWSWASQLGSIIFPAYKFPILHPAYEILEASTTTRSESKFGTLASGTLRVKAPIVEMVSLESASGPGFWQIRGSKDELHELETVWITPNWPSPIEPTHLLPLAHGDSSPLEYICLGANRVRGRKGTFTKINCYSFRVPRSSQDVDTAPPWWIEGCSLEEDSYRIDFGAGVYEVDFI